MRNEGRASLSQLTTSRREELADRIAVLNTRLLAFDSPATLRSTSAEVSVWSNSTMVPRQTIQVRDLSEIPTSFATWFTREANRAGRARSPIARRRFICRSWERLHDGFSQRITALAGKDARELLRNPGAILPPVLMVFASLRPAFLVAIAAPMIACGPLEEGDFVEESAAATTLSRSGRTEREARSSLPISVRLALAVGAGGGRHVARDPRSHR